MIQGKSHRNVPAFDKLAKLLKEAHNEATDFIKDHNHSRKTEIRDKIAEAIFELECLPVNYKITATKIRI